MRFDWLDNELHCEMLFKIVLCYLAFTGKARDEIIVCVQIKNYQNLLANTAVSRPTLRNHGNWKFCYMECLHGCNKTIPRLNKHTASLETVSKSFKSTGLKRYLRYAYMDLPLI
jgi:hypothetical protein